MAGRLHGRPRVTSGDTRPSGSDALRRRVDLLGGASSRRAEAGQALRGFVWLEELRLRFDLAVEILSADLEYVLDPLHDLHVSTALRAALHRVGDTVLRDTVTTVLQSGRPTTLGAEEFRVRFVPLFLRSAGAPLPLAVLALGAMRSDHRRRAVDQADDSLDRRVEGTAQWLVAAIDASLAATLKEAADARSLERMAGSFDVVDALTELHDEREIIALLMDAIALWYDADVYAYRQELSGDFTLHASLPGVDVSHAVPRLLGHQIWGRGDVFSAESHGELDALGWPASIGQTLFLPISVDQSTEWLLAIAEAGDDVETRRTLGIFGRVAGSLLADLQHEVMDRLTRKLTSILLFGDAPLHATATIAFQAVAAETGASSVQFAVFDVAGGGKRRVLSLHWGEDTEPVPFVDAETTKLALLEIAVGIGTGSGVTAVLRLKRDTGAFATVAQRLARAAAATIGIWLSGSLAASTERPSEGGDYGSELVQRMRHQVDRFGHVKVAGAVAVLLPQSAGDTHAVDEAVELIEHHVRPSDVIGAVGSTGAGVLLADASREVASAVVGRLLRAAREKGRLAVRVGVAMFAASTESPESVLERALLNARRGSAV